MGEYAHRTDGKTIKIGTCENLYALRADQVDHILDIENIPDQRAMSYWEASLFRFPFPDEDHVAPGEFDDYDRGLFVPIDLPMLKHPEVTHADIQFKGARFDDLLVMLPCPQSGKAQAEGQPTIMRNGSQPGVVIAQQRIWESKLVLVIDCGTCGRRLRMPNFAEVTPIMDYLLSQAQSEGSIEPAARFWLPMAQRITDGYLNPPAWIAKPVEPITQGGGEDQ